MFEALENRRLLSVSLGSNGVLDVEGTRRNDRIELSVYQVVRNNKTVDILKVVDNGATRTFDAASVKLIQANGGNGEDLIRLAPSVHINSILHGGNGKDSLFGGSGNDKLYGDNAKDYLNGGAGNDFLWGGNGTDTLIGGAGNDMLDGGRAKDSVVQ